MARRWGTIFGDTIHGTKKDDIIKARGGSDTVYGYGGNDVIYDGGGNRYGNIDVVWAGSGDDTIHGGDSKGVLFGESGIDKIYGGSGDDDIYGGTENDELYGQSGNDLLFGGEHGNRDIIDGGEGIDTIHFGFAAGAVTLDLGDTTSSDPSTDPMDSAIAMVVKGDRDFVINVENIRGSNHADVLTGDHNDNTIEGWFGVDKLYGDAGDDHLYGQFDDDMLWGGAGRDYLNGGDGVDMLWGEDDGDMLYGVTGDDHLYGNAGNDYLHGGDGVDMLWGGDGVDTLVGGLGDDHLHGGLGDDHLDGGLGVDRYLFDTGIRMAGSGSDTIYDRDGGTLVFNRLMNTDGIMFTVVAGKVTITFPGETKINAPRVTIDYLTIVGSSQRSIYSNDLENVDSESAPMEQSAPTRTLFTAYYGPEESLLGTLYVGTNGDDTNFIGSDEADWIAGVDGDDIIDGRAGNDTIDGGQGNDILEGNRGNDRLYGREGRDTLNGGVGNDELYGGGRGDTLNGGAGNDILDGGAGRDILDGGAGDDNLDGGAGGDTLNGGAGGDTLNGGAGRDTLNGGAGNDILDGGAGDDILDGGEGADDYVLTLKTGHDLIQGDEDGGNLLFQDAELDDFSFSRDANDNVVLAIGSSSITISQEVYASDLYKAYYGADNRELGDLSVGTDANDRIRGSVDRDWILGLGGNDHLTGGIGNDRLEGGEGKDFLFGGSDDDNIYGGEGRDILYGGTENDTLDGGAENDLLSGGEGDDTLYGGEGDDKLYGGEGSDSYVFESGHGADYIHSDTDGGKLYFKDASRAEDLIFSRLNSGNDLKITLDGDSVTIVQSAYYESIYKIYYGSDDTSLGNMWVGTSRGDEITGSDDADWILGLQGWDVLQGAGGRDRLQGGEGRDHLFGGEDNDQLIGGADSDVLYGGLGEDIINGSQGADAAAYQDSSKGVRVSLLLQEQAQIDFDGTHGFFANGNEAVGDTLFSIENIWGSNHKDWLTGDNNNNRFIAEGGDDRIEGGQGTDTYIFEIGDGSDTIIDNKGDEMILRFGNSGIASYLAEDFDSSVFSRNGNNLEINLDKNADDGITDKITIVDAYLSEPSAEKGNTAFTINIEFDTGGSHTQQVLDLWSALT